MFAYTVFIITLVVLQSCVSYARVAPDYITPCVGLKSACLKKNIQETIPRFVKGIPSLAVNSTDPLTYDYVNVELPGGLKIEFKDGVLKGLRNCLVNEAKFQNNDADVELTCNVTIKGKYKAQGQILIISINGDGDAKLKITDLNLKIKLKFIDNVRDGVTYYDVKDYKVNYNINGKVQFALTNLFKGNPELGQTVLTFLNENWKLVDAEFGKPLVDIVIGIAFKNVQKFFSNIPKDELVVL
uniref:Takeout/JHBP like protein n=1 Tax=Papilio xuthus TaxID=66420 RepID=I4DIS3_PAPXU|nr:protein takeout-like precursor [Papilio xuthus]BAM17813.1 takeout/JHBP like protein [Papilio xuthus]